MARPTSPSDSEHSAVEVTEEKPTKDPQAEEEDDEEEEAEEYEIERIIDAKRGVFADVRVFLVPLQTTLLKRRSRDG